MAEHAQSADYNHGDMPVGAQSNTYTGVMGLFKWGALGCADLLILLVLWFCTPAGFVPGLVVSVIVLIAGLVGLRKKTGAH